MHDAIDFSPVKQAGIATSNFAKVCGVSRLTATLWLTGKSQPRGLYRVQAARRVAAIRAALERGDLPIAPMPPAQRLTAICEALSISI